MGLERESRSDTVAQVFLQINAYYTVVLHSIGLVLSFFISVCIYLSVRLFIFVCNSSLVIQQPSRTSVEMSLSEQSAALMD